MVLSTIHNLVMNIFLYHQIFFVKYYLNCTHVIILNGYTIMYKAIFLLYESFYCII